MQEGLKFPSIEASDQRGPARIAAVLQSGDIGTEMRLATEPLEDIDLFLRVGALGELNGAVREIEKADVLILEVDTANATDMAVFTHLCGGAFHDRPVIATCKSVSLQSTRALLNAGAVDVLPQPVSQASLLVALEKALTRARKHGGDSDGGRVISFLKGGGGVGATATIVQMAQTIVTHKSDTKLCIIDLDLQSGATALYLDLVPKRNILDLIGQEGRVDGSLLRAVMARHESGIHVLAAPPHIVPLECINTAQAEQIIRLARQEFDVVLIDLPGVWNEWSDRVLHLSDQIVLITELSIYNANQTKRQLHMLETQGLDKKPLRLVANRYHKKLFGDIGLEDCKKCLGRAFTDTIPNDFDLVSKALNAGLSVSQFKRNSKYEKAIYNIAEECAAVHTPAHAE